MTWTTLDMVIVAIASSSIGMSVAYFILTRGR